MLCPRHGILGGNSADGAIDLQSINFLCISKNMQSYNLCYRQHSDAPPEFKKTWDGILETLDFDHTQFVEEWIQKLSDSKVGTEQDRQVLKRCEGGIGGNNNSTSRQIRFQRKPCPFLNFREINLHAIASNNGDSVWGLEELICFGEKLKEVFVERVGTGLQFYIRVYNS